MPALDVTLLQDLLGPDGPELDLFEEIGSTNTFLLEREFGAVPAGPRLAVAERQLAGRGRRGRSWVAEAGRSACLSLAFEPARAPAPGLSLAVGCRIAASLETLTDGLALKWPNDLLRHGRKCGGILIESRPGRTNAGPVCRVVVGIGLNLLSPLDTSTMGQPVGGLFDGRGRPYPAEAVIAAAARACIAAHGEHLSRGLAAFIDEWERLDAWRGREVELSDSGRVLARGIARGISADGALRLESAAGEQRVVSGDLSLRGSSGGAIA